MDEKAIFRWVMGALAAAGLGGGGYYAERYADSQDARARIESMEQRALVRDTETPMVREQFERRIDRLKARVEALERCRCEP